MRKKIVSMLTAILLIVSIFAFAACGRDSGDDVIIDDEGNIISGNANVLFWGWGGEQEVKIFSGLVEKFNAENENIHVEYVQKPSDTYDSVLGTSLAGRSGPDVFYVGEASVKKYVASGMLEPLDEYLKTSQVIKEDEMWPSSMIRYRINESNWTNGAEETLYAVPKDISPTAIYYNKDAFSQVNVDIISVDAEDLAAYNAENSTNYPARGFFTLNGSGEGATDNTPTLTAGTNAVKNMVDSAKAATKRVFNNRIAMTWDESIALAGLMTKSHNSASITDYGYFTEWWFSYGWSVGGDCIKFDEASGKWIFTLGDDSKMWIKEGKLYPSDPGGGTQLSKSQLDAFTHFVQLSQPTTINTDGRGNYGFAVTPSPTTVGTDAAKVSYFTSGKLAMLVDGRYSTVAIRENATFDWDVAPLPKSPDGIEAGHSGSMGIAVRKASKIKTAAWKFAEYIAGEVGQSAQAESGFNIPNQMSIANSEVFLQSDKKPKNAEIFVRAAAYQRAGDWTYLADRYWINEWAPLLNGDVRNGKTTLTEFFEAITDSTNNRLLAYS